MGGGLSQTSDAPVTDPRISMGVFLSSHTYANTLSFMEGLSCYFLFKIECYQLRSYDIIHFHYVKPNNGDKSGLEGGWAEKIITYRYCFRSVGSFSFYSIGSRFTSR